MVHRGSQSGAPGSKRASRCPKPRIAVPEVVHRNVRDGAPRFSNGASRFTKWCTGVKSYIAVPEVVHHDA
ncbi:unnamed protein product [Gongylonema pulchrum]|uniref:Uncharacterized protein n=1 Tax=Gongylonema pulchrum TaxID=637853 RepID=A0A183F0F5_9BILA|nr:unnamed protein product [Gongylonema pulchrum]